MTSLEEHVIDACIEALEDGAEPPHEFTVRLPSRAVAALPRVIDAAGYLIHIEDERCQTSKYKH